MQGSQSQTCFIQCDKVAQELQAHLWLSPWNPVSAMEGNQTLNMAIALLLQVLPGVPSSFTSQQGTLLLFSAWKGEFEGSLRA